MVKGAHSINAYKENECFSKECFGIVVRWTSWCGHAALTGSVLYPNICHSSPRVLNEVLKSSGTAVSCARVGGGHELVMLSVPVGRKSFLKLELFSIQDFTVNLKNRTICSCVFEIKRETLMPYFGIDNRTGGVGWNTIQFFDFKTHES